MRQRHILAIPAVALALTLLPAVLASAPPQVRPYFPAETGTPTRRFHAAANAADPVVHALASRQTSAGCISGTFSCADQGSSFSGICCATGQTCALDASNEPACCPSGAVCTGVAPSSYKPPTTTAVSYVANAYFSFPYIATSFSNAAACSRAASQCAANYDACTADLEGGSGGVTVVVAGSTTVRGVTATATYAASTAVSICSSLSSVACSDIQTSYCTAGSTAGFSVGTAAGNAAARPTAALRCVGVAAGVAAGVGLGMVGI